MDRDKQTTSSTKQKILDAALDLIASFGYKGASVRKIAKAVGIRESAIYNHFKNKEEIFASIMQNLFVSPLDEFFTKKPPQIYAKRGKIYLLEFAMNIKILSFDSRHEKLFRIILVELMQNEKIRQIFLQKFFDEYIKHLSNAFFVMMQEGLIRSGDPLLMAQEFFAPLFYFRLHTLLLRMDDKSTTSLSTIFEKHVEFFWEGVAISS